MIFMQIMAYPFYRIALRSGTSYRPARKRTRFTAQQNVRVPVLQKLSL